MPGTGAISGSAEAGSDRVRLARLALAAALVAPDVDRGDAGLRVPRVTPDPPGVLVGVAATAQADGRYSIDLRLVARPVALLSLADEVRRRVQREAARAELDDLLGEINVEFSDLLTSPIEDTGGYAADTDEPPASPTPPGVLG